MPAPPRALGLLALFAAAWGPPATAAEMPLSRIAFGSCANQDRPQPIWDAVVEIKPQRFVFLGDNIYADTPDMGVNSGRRQRGRRSHGSPGTSVSTPPQVQLFSRQSKP
jgi:alkaline phosphatase D